MLENSPVGMERQGEDLTQIYLHSAMHLLCRTTQATKEETFCVLGVLNFSPCLSVINGQRCRRLALERVLGSTKYTVSD